MKKIIALLALSLLAGCALFHSPDRPGYQAGRTTEFFYIASKPALPEKITLAVEGGYDMIRLYGIASAEAGADEEVRALIEDKYPDATPEFRAMVFNFYSMAKNRLQSEVASNVNIPQSEVVENFLQGIADAKTDYSVKK